MRKHGDGRLTFAENLRICLTVTFKSTHDASARSGLRVAIRTAFVGCSGHSKVFALRSVALVTDRKEGFVQFNDAGKNSIGLITLKDGENFMTPNKSRSYANVTQKRTLL